MSLHGAPYSTQHTFVDHVYYIYASRIFVPKIEIGKVNKFQIAKTVRSRTALDTDFTA